MAEGRHLALSKKQARLVASSVITQAKCSAQRVYMYTPELREPAAQGMKTYAAIKTPLTVQAAAQYLKIWQEG